jgi:peptide/nickel transport system substrate-binding protein
MVQGVAVVNNSLMNVPQTLGNDWPLRTPGNARPEQWYFKK